MMPGLVMDELDAEDKDDKDEVGRINAMQGTKICFICKKTGHLKKD